MVIDIFYGNRYFFKTKFGLLWTRSDCIGLKNYFISVDLASSNLIHPVHINLVMKYHHHHNRIISCVGFVPKFIKSSCLFLSGF